MSLIYRRTWEKPVFGRNGAISSSLPARSGTDGAFGGSPTWSAPLATFTSATASFVAGDVGRIIRLGGVGTTVTNSTPSNRYEGLYIISSINSGTSVELRVNHNTGSAASPAQFGEAGSSIAWRIMESATFTADAAGDLAAYNSGSYVVIEGDSNSANNGMWRISHYLTNQTCIISKSYIWWPIDVTTMSYFVADAGATFVNVASGLQWSLADREPLNGADAALMCRQAAIDAGWVLWQQRGNSSSAVMFWDDILRSTGETSADLPDGKIQYLRMNNLAYSRISQGQFSAINFYMTPFLSWDRTATATLPGNGLAPLRSGSAASNTSGTNTTPTGSSSNGDFTWDNISVLGLNSNGCNLILPGRGGQPWRIYRRDFLMIGDADELTFYTNDSGTGTTASTQQLLTLGTMKLVGSNPFTSALAAAATGGGTATLTVNTGTQDFATKGYAVGDRVTVRGLRVGTPEYIESGTIATFSGSSPNFTMTLTALQSTWASNGYGGGSDSKKAFIGQDPFCMAILSNGVGGGAAFRMHNASNLGNATGKDWDASSFGTTSVSASSLAAYTNLSPNMRTGNKGVLGVEGQINTNSEFRGSWRYIRTMECRDVTQGKKFIDPTAGTVYVGVVPAVGSLWNTNSLVVFGPISKAQAGVK